MQHRSRTRTAQGAHDAPAARPTISPSGRLRQRRAAIIAITIAAGLGAGAIVAVNGAAQTPGAQTLSIVTKNCEFKFVDVAPRSRRRNSLPGAGDYLVISCQEVDSTGAHIGRFDGICHETLGGKRLRSVCEQIYELNDGEIHTLARTVGMNAVEGSVVGGTGAYAGARGTFTSRDRPGEKDGDPADNTITRLR